MVSRIFPSGPPDDAELNFLAGLPAVEGALSFSEYGPKAFQIDGRDVAIQLANLKAALCQATGSIAA